MKLNALLIILIATILLAGCAVVNSHDYVHASTEQLRKSFYRGGEDIDRKAHTHFDVSGVMIIPDLRLSRDGKVIQGALHILSRDEQAVRIEQVMIQSENAEVSETRVLSTITAPKVTRDGLWVARVELRPGFRDSAVKTASKVELSVILSDAGQGQTVTTRLILEKTKRRSLAWVT